MEKVTFLNDSIEGQLGWTQDNPWTTSLDLDEERYIKSKSAQWAQQEWQLSKISSDVQRKQSSNQIEVM